MFEVTLGLAQIASSPLSENLRIAFVLFLLGWGGLSVHAQVAAFLAEAGVSFRAFPLYRLLHGALSGALSLLVWPYVEPHMNSAGVAVGNPGERFPGTDLVFSGNPWLFSLALAALLALGLALGSRGRNRSSAF